MSELETEYGDRVNFNVVPAEQTAQSADEIELYGFTALKHGLVGFNSAGEAVVKIPGHQFGKDRIEEAVQTVLAN